MKKKLGAFGLSLITLTVYAQSPSDLYQKNWPKALSLYQKMSVDQRLGQLVQVNYQVLAMTTSANAEACKMSLADPYVRDAQIVKACGLDQIAQYHLGSVLSGGDPHYNAPTLPHWQKLNALAQAQHRLGNPWDPVLLIGNDAIHGNAHVQGAVVFPHNIGLGVSHDPALVEQMAHAIGQDSLLSGFNWVFMPTVAVAQDLRWGRTYESFGQQPEWVKVLAKAYVSGFQNIQHDKVTGPLATAKHFIGDGGTQYGLDEGDDAFEGSQADFWRVHGQGYEGAVDAHVATIMVSYSAIDDAHTQNNTRMHFGGKWDIVNQFKQAGILGTDGQRYRFTGFVISDWDGVNRAGEAYNVYHPPLTFPHMLAKAINGGVDMIMIGEAAPPEFSNTDQVMVALKTAYQQGWISPEKLQQTVTRILAVKLAMASQTPKAYPALQQEERRLALQAAQESLVLLKNDHVLPLSTKTIQNVVFVGPSDDLGIQNGAWSVTWQGQKSNRFFTGLDQVSSGAQTIEQAIQARLPIDTHYYHESDGLNDRLLASNTVVVAVVAEAPYAEFFGDIANSHQEDYWYRHNAGVNPYFGMPQNTELSLQFTQPQSAVIEVLKKRHIPVVTIVYSGRPIILSQGGAKAPLTQSDALIAAFLPGTLGGQALADSLFGDYRFRSHMNGQSNTLTFPWPENMDQVMEHFVHGALFPIGYGLAD